MNIRIVKFPVAESVAESEKQIREIARLADAPERGEALIARSTLPSRPRGRTMRNAIRALIWQGGGMVPGQGTLADELLQLTGYRNMSAEYGLPRSGACCHWSTSSLRRRSWCCPSARVRRASDRMLDHPAVRELANGWPSASTRSGCSSAVARRSSKPLRGSRSAQRTGVAAVTPSMPDRTPQLHGIESRTGAPAARATERHTRTPALPRSPRSAGRLNAVNQRTAQARSLVAGNAAHSHCWPHSLSIAAGKVWLPWTAWTLRRPSLAHHRRAALPANRAGARRRRSTGPLGRSDARLPAQPARRPRPLRHLIGRRTRRDAVALLRLSALRRCSCRLFASSGARRPC